MADGHEEREEQEQRRKWDQERDREDRIVERHPDDSGKPERQES
jgi:hypothetical protein